jgi:hypothetical protein
MHLICHMLESLAIAEDLAVASHTCLQSHSPLLWMQCHRSPGTTRNPPPHTAAACSNAETSGSKIQAQSSSDLAPPNLSSFPHSITCFADQHIFCLQIDTYLIVKWDQLLSHNLCIIEKHLV